MKLILTLSAALIFCSTAISCPLGANDTELTFQRVMLNFGKYTRLADRIARDGVVNPQSISDTDLAQAIQDLNTVRSCSQAVLQNPQGKLLPATYYKLPESEKPEYLKSLLRLLNSFDKASAALGFELQVQLDTSPRDFQKVSAITKAMADLADMGHEGVEKP